MSTQVYLISDTPPVFTGDYLWFWCEYGYWHMFDESAWDTLNPISKSIYLYWHEYQLIAPTINPTHPDQPEPPTVGPEQKEPPEQCIVCGGDEPCSHDFDKITWPAPTAAGTPRTDAAEKRYDHKEGMADFARTLERELAASQAEVARLHDHFNEDYRELQADLAAAEQSADHWQSEWRKQEEAHRLADREVAELQTKLTAEEADVRKCDAIIDGLNEQVAELARERDEISNKWYAVQGFAAARSDEINELKSDLANAQRDTERYNELIYAVATKHDNETRHETALRYIREREARIDGPAQSALHPSDAKP